MPPLPAGRAAVRATRRRRSVSRSSQERPAVCARLGGYGGQGPAHCSRSVWSRLGLGSGGVRGLFIAPAPRRRSPGPPARTLYPRAHSDCRRRSPVCSRISRHWSSGSRSRPHCPSVVRLGHDVRNVSFYDYSLVKKDESEEGEGEEIRW